MLALLMSLVPIARPAHAQTSKLEWADGLCHTTLEFDRSSVDETQLRNSIIVTEGVRPDQIGGGQPGPETSYPDLFNTMNPPQPTIERRLQVVEYERTCRNSADFLARLDLLDLPGIRQFRDEQFSAQREFCRFSAIVLRARLGETAAIHEFTPAPVACSAFADVLDGKTELEPFWRRFVPAQCANNGDPAGCAERFQRLADQHGNAQMRDLILQFGWNNCMVGSLMINAKREEFTAARQRLREALTARFRVTDQCGTD